MRIFIAIIVLAFHSCAYQNEEADLVIHNAIIYSCDDSFSIHHAMAIKDGKILEIGPERQIVNKYNAEKSIDNQSRPIYPTFIGSHSPIRDFMSTARKLHLLHSDRRDVLMTLTKYKALQELIEDYGTLEKGKQANFFITDADLLTAKAENIEQINIVSTFKEGVELE